MSRNLVLTSVAALFFASAAVAQASAPPNVNPGSMQSGAGETGAGNQPRSPGMRGHGTGKLEPHRAVHRAPPATDGINADVKAGSTRSGHSESGPAASSPR